jgi:hypothetical protein
MVAIKKYHGNKIDALHFLKIAYKKPRCPSPYEKCGRYSLYDWFTNRREVKAKYAHLAELTTQIQTKK